MLRNDSYDIQCYLDETINMYNFGNDKTVNDILESLKITFEQAIDQMLFLSLEGLDGEELIHD